MTTPVTAEHESRDVAQTAEPGHLAQADAAAPAGPSEAWLAATREFWNVDSTFVARYRRICSDPEIEACEDEEQLKELWDRRTEAELPVLLAGIPIDACWVSLEIGCGIGRLLKPLAARCKRVIGIDLAPQMIDFAREYLHAVDNAELHVNDGKSLGMVPDQSVDFVYSMLTFQHITLPEVVDAYLAEIRRVLKPGGWFRVQCWREAQTPFVERIKNVGRRMLGREPYRASRSWVWEAGKKVQFSGVAHEPQAWRRRLEAADLRVVDLTYGHGHDFWMWTTCQRS
jgi:SAM-dependent methyltransferase